MEFSQEKNRQLAQELVSGIPQEIKDEIALNVMDFAQDLRLGAEVHEKAERVRFDQKLEDVLLAKVKSLFKPDGLIEIYDLLTQEISYVVMKETDKLLEEERESVVFSAKDDTSQCSRK